MIMKCNLDSTVKKALDKKVKLISKDLELIGIVSLRLARKIARERDCDLLFVRNTAKEPLYIIYPSDIVAEIMAWKPPL